VRLSPLAPIGLAVTLVAGGAAHAHHSFSANYDFNQPVRVTGVVTEVVWTNPHISFAVDVKGRNGKVTTWTFSGDAATALTRRGVLQTTIPVGETVRVDGFRARDGSNSGAAGAVTLPNGRRVFVGPLEDPTPI
jgi:hypothetical protein